MRRPVLALASAALLSACAAGGDDPSASPGSAAASATETVASPTVSVSAEPSDTAERLYPYSLAWPADQVEGEWRFATAAWDGEGRIDHGNAYTDLLETTDGPLFAFGVPTDEGVEALRDRISQQTQVWHGCNLEPNVEEALSGGGVDGIYGEYTCRASRVLRWVGVNDGFGLFVGLIVGPGQVDDAAPRFKAQIAELEWTD